MNNNYILNYVLETAIRHVESDFDKKDRKNTTINYINYEYEISISRNCYHNTDSKNNYSYYEDYCINFKGKMNNRNIYSIFYLEWEDNKLVPSNTIYDAKNGKFKNRNIKIHFYD